MSASSLAGVCSHGFRWVAPPLQLMVLAWGLTAQANALMTAPVEAQPVLSRSPPLVQAGDIDSAEKSELLELNALSRSLVERARSGRADATQFRIDATLYRESLRRLMLASDGTDATSAEDNALHVHMVRMAALLHAAAECKTGRYITCPPDLMRQLDAQQKLLDRNMDAYRGAAS